MIPSPAGTRQGLSKIPAKIQKVITGGGGGIRTHGTFQFAGFQDR